MVGHLTNALQYLEWSNVVVLKLPWGLLLDVFCGKQDLATDCIINVLAVGIGIAFLLDLGI